MTPLLLAYSKEDLIVLYWNISFHCGQCQQQYSNGKQRRSHWIVNSGNFSRCTAHQIHKHHICLLENAQPPQVRWFPWKLMVLSHTRRPLSALIAEKRVILQDSAQSQRSPRLELSMRRSMSRLSLGENPGKGWKWIGVSRQGVRACWCLKMHSEEQEEDDKSKSSQEWKDKSLGDVVGPGKSRKVQGRVFLELETRTNNNHSKEMNMYVPSLI